MTARALLREIPETFSNALVRHGSPALDVGRARAQHQVYRSLIETAGYEATVLPADDNHPDCLFVEDTVVVIHNTAVMTRPGAPSRRGEVETIAESLAQYLAIERLTAPATLDGGDVFIMNGTVHVGRSERTNEAGISQLAEIASRHDLETTPINVSEVLHLKSAVHPINEWTVVVTPGTVDEALLSDLRVLHEAPGERHRFSALPLPGTVVVDETAPRTNEMVAALGIEVAPIDVSEIRAADGGLTCMSILHG